jgi:hypothetical protein
MVIALLSMRKSLKWKNNFITARFARLEVFCDVPVAFPVRFAPSEPADFPAAVRMPNYGSTVKRWPRFHF